MNFPDLSEFIPFLKAILRHFQLSGKSIALLNKALEMMDMKTIHMMTYYPNPMSFYCINPNCQFTCSTLWCPCHSKYQRRREKPLHATKRNDSCSLARWFEKYFFQKLFENLRLSWWPSYQISTRFAEKMKDLETKLSDNFIENLKEDINGNIIAEIKENV